MNVIQCVIRTLQGIQRTLWFRGTTLAEATIRCTDHLRSVEEHIVISMNVLVDSEVE